MDNAQSLVGRMSVLQLLRRNKLRSVLCLIVVALGAVIFSNTVLRA